MEFDAGEEALMATTYRPQGSRNRPCASKELEVDKLFAALVKLEGSDLHLKVDVPAARARQGEPAAA